MRIGIVGLGLIGGSLAGALSRSRHEVWGFDIREEAQRVAVDKGYVRGIERPEALAAASDVLFLCMPIGETVASIPELAPRMRRDAVLTDVASVKRPVMLALNAVVNGPVSIGGHPMAGRAAGGIEAAEVNLFTDASYALVRSRHTTSAGRQTLAGLIKDMGAHPVEIGADEHDRQVAWTSHVPQLLSSALSLLGEAMDRQRPLGGSMAHGGGETPGQSMRAKRGQAGSEINPPLQPPQEEVMRLSGPGLAGMLRLAHSDERLWSEILIANSDEVVVAVDALRGILDALRDRIEAGDRKGVEALLRQAREAAR